MYICGPSSKIGTQVCQNLDNFDTGLRKVLIIMQKHLLGTIISLVFFTIKFCIACFSSFYVWWLRQGYDQPCNSLISCAGHYLLDSDTKWSIYWKIWQYFSLISKLGLASTNNYYLVWRWWWWPSSSHMM